MRRTREYVEKAAQQAVAVIKSKGSTGATAGDLKRFGIVGSPTKWFKNFAPKVVVKKRGDKAKTRCFVG